MLGKRKKMSIKNYHSFMHYLFVNQTIKKEKKKSRIFVFKAMGNTIAFSGTVYWCWNVN